MNEKGNTKRTIVEENHAKRQLAFERVDLLHLVLQPINDIIELQNLLRYGANLRNVGQAGDWSLDERFGRESAIESEFGMVKRSHSSTRSSEFLPTQAIDDICGDRVEYMKD